MLKLPSVCRPVLFCALAAMLPGTAWASVSGLVLRVTVRSADHSATTDIPISDAQFEADVNWVDWTLSDEATLGDAGQPLATFLDANVTVGAGADPNVEFSFSLLAGQQDIVCDVRTLWLGFEPPAAGTARGRATASVSVTDVDGNGADLRAIGPPGSGAFRATLDGGTRFFTQLISQIVVGPGGTAAGFQSDPAVGFRPISGTFARMDSRMSFTLSRNDLASATTTFELRSIPEYQLFEDGDLNCDTDITVSDITGFISAMFDPIGYDEQFADCSAQLADVDGNGAVTVGDIAAFVEAMAGGLAPPPAQASFESQFEEIWSSWDHH